MAKITSAEQLNTIKTKLEPRFKVRHDPIFINDPEEMSIRVCTGSSCTGSGAVLVKEAFDQAITEGKLENRVKMIQNVTTGCHGLCSMGPIVIINPGEVLYTRVKPEDVPEIVERHLLKGEIVERLLFHDPVTGAVIFDYENINFYKFATRRILKYNGFINPWSIEEYIATGGYQALAKALTQMKPEDVIEEIRKSGLRGRGGAGYPTASKWATVRAALSDIKYLVCNGDEGDPGAYMNRSVLEGNPHSVLEGMILGAYGIGNVHKGYAYIRAELALTIKTLQNAIDQAKEYGLLGNNILGTDFSFDIEIFQAAGAFVCGEETALLTSIEGKRGAPHQRPPFPVDLGGGLFGKPTTINNVETWANVSMIMREGADWFRSVGTEKSPGTKTFSLVNKVAFTGLVEVPLGTPIGNLIFDIGGGTPNGKKFKAVEIGGPSGGVIPAEFLNTPIDYDSIQSLGAIISSGAFAVMDEDSCMVDVARYFLDFTKGESCGKCISCRVGNPKMYDILTKICEGKATMHDLVTLEELAGLVKTASICGLGRTSSNPVLTALKYFREEFISHIIDKKCPAAVCQSLFKAPCQHVCPVGLNVPGYISLIKEGRMEDALKMIMQCMPFPLSVGRVCPAPCQRKCRRSQVDEAVAIRQLKRYAADYAYEHDLEYHPEIKAWRKERIAIIGAGPAGLAAAWDLSIEGYHVTVFEALPVAGGMLAVGIPEYRLPKKYLQWEIENIVRLGVDLRLNTPVDDIPALLKKGVDAVLIAVGAHKGNKMGIPGEDMNGVIDAVDFLRGVYFNEPIRIGHCVSIIGGGNSAIDAARVAIRKGAKEVNILYRREQADMPADEEEVAAAIQEGVHIYALTTPVRVIGEKGIVSGVECLRNEPKEFGRTGRRNASPVPGSEHIIKTDMLIKAIGQEPDTVNLTLGNAQRARDGRITADKRTLATGGKGIFVAGDAFTGPATVVEAVASGQRAASSIRRYLRGEELSPVVSRNGYKVIEVSDKPPTEAEMKEKPRAPVHEIPLRERQTSFAEAMVSYTPAEAAAESARCLRCDLESEE